MMAAKRFVKGRKVYLLAQESCWAYVQATVTAVYRKVIRVKEYSGIWPKDQAFFEERQAMEAAVKRNNLNKSLADNTDGYHSFNQLYHHRAALFAFIVNVLPRYSWKSKAHSDGTMFDGMFIVGIDIPQIGQVSYHFDLPYYDLFRCKELQRGLQWDGHTPEDVITRLLTLSEAVDDLDKRQSLMF